MQAHEGIAVAALISLGAALLQAGVTPPEPVAGLPPGLADCEALWRSSGVTSYEIQIDIVASWDVNTIRSVVVGGQVVSVGIAPDNSGLDIQKARARHGALDVNDLFAEAARAWRRGFNLLRVTCDQQLGYPRILLADPANGITDLGVTYNAVVVPIDHKG